MHPDREGVATCARCGDYFCGECAHPRSSEHCAKCDVPTGFAWERAGPTFRAFFVTLFDLLIRTGRGWPPPSSPWRALGLYGVLVVLVTLSYVGVGVLVISFAPDVSWRPFALSLGWSFARWLGVPPILALGYLLVARLSGTSVGFGPALRASTLAAAVPLVLSPVTQAAGFATPFLTADVDWVIFGGLVRSAFFGLLFLALKLRVWWAQVRWDTRERGRPGVAIALVLLWLIGSYAWSLYPGLQTLYDLSRL